jgi:hypothetical protein
MTALHAERRLTEILTLRNLMEDDVDVDAADIQHIEDLIAAELSIIHSATVYEPLPYQRTAIPPLTIDGLDDSECLLFTRFLDKAQLHRLFAALEIPDEVRIVDDSNRTHVFQGEECLLFCLHRVASGTSLEEIAQHVHGRDASQWSRVWRWFIRYMVHLGGLFQYIVCVSDSEHTLFCQVLHINSEFINAHQIMPQSEEQLHAS